LKKSIFQFCNILKEVRIENIYAKFQKEIRKIDRDTAVFVKQHLCLTGRLYTETASGADEKAFFDVEELLYDPKIAE